MFSSSWKHKSPYRCLLNKFVLVCFGEHEVSKSDCRKILFGEGDLTIEDIVNVSQSQDPVALSENKDFRNRIDAEVRFLDKILSEEGHIYGVTTGYGDSVMFEVPYDLIEELPMHLTRFHGCGLGDFFTPEQSRAILATRLTSLTRGYSGVSWNLLDLLVNS